MIINDISHIEVATEEETNIQGGLTLPVSPFVGLAFGDATASAGASGVFFAGSFAGAATFVQTGVFSAFSSSGAGASATSN